MAEIERRPGKAAVEVTLRVVNGRAQFDSWEHARTEGNILWVGDQ